MDHDALRRAARYAVGPVPRRLVQAGFAANALRPVPGAPLSVGAMFAGWLTAELAPQLAAATAIDTAVELVHPSTRGRDRALALGSSAFSLAAYGWMIRTALKAGDEVDAALRNALGTGYRDLIAREPRPDDPLSWRDLARFRVRRPDVTRVRRLAYAPGGKRYELDVFHHADKPAGRPVLLQVHGGGWVIGNKEEQGQPLMNHMAARGWVGVAVNYPLSPKARWPEHLVALKRAVAWIREHAAEYGGDPSFIAVTGGSAGGHLAAMLALTGGDETLQPGFEDVDTTLQACIPHYGVYDFTDESGAKFTRQRLDSLIRPIVMPRGARYPEDYRAASPVFRVREDAPPFLVIHGRNDTLVPVDDARWFVDKLRAVSKNPVAYAELPGTQHAFDVFPSIRSAYVLRGVEYFLEWCLKTHGAARSSDAAG
ncbi:MAG: alpha/beta hydrolase fold domain-containing protein [Jatrophihabitans sp.]|uniref:alpha/beta hydrolase fold domain-containing protein n=1 Tax=Jatrophihabitans sp. TaxID=1932789 RepID=UPI003F7D23FF